MKLLANFLILMTLFPFQGSAQLNDCHEVNRLIVYIIPVGSLRIPNSDLEAKFMKETRHLSRIEENKYELTLPQAQIVTKEDLIPPTIPGFLLDSATFDLEFFEKECTAVFTLKYKTIYLLNVSIDGIYTSKSPITIDKVTTHSKSLTLNKLEETGVHNIIVPILWGRNYKMSYNIKDHANEKKQVIGENMTTIKNNILRNSRYTSDQDRSLLNRMSKLPVDTITITLSPCIPCD